MRVLVVDDAKFMRLTLGNILKKHGHEVFEAENGADAVAKYHEIQPDLVTMDITMPEMDGLEAVKRIKAVDPKAKIVMVSAMAQKDYVIEAIQSGAIDFIIKPFQEERIREVLKRLG
ncbi:response regulator receiver protein [Desulfofundulus kuznetsovii DSM 6115]|uniref:Stage 0 sporulation protein A homolog n=1 Tax=Desulfofundulus kuznetsovii (strain DSM 6115 / VKM B-1805 / 17) TaxID=760568 RepID=A0AAU8PFX5_DESK7|nr:response regulator receiver protein [Desulfofundulus kuznetsovii DSM 6115]